MNIRIRLNLDGLTRKAERVRSGVEAGLDDVAEAGKHKKDEFIAETYNRPLGPNQPPRTGNWKNGQRIEKAPGRRTIKTVGPATKYEPGLANLPTGRDGINRSNAAGEKTADWLEQNAQGIFERGFEEHMRS